MEGFFLTPGFFFFFFLFLFFGKLAMVDLLGGAFSCRLNSELLYTLYTLLSRVSTYGNPTRLASQQARAAKSREGYDRRMGLSADQRSKSTADLHTPDKWISSIRVSRSLRPGPFVAEPRRAIHLSHTSKHPLARYDEDGQVDDNRL